MARWLARFSFSFMILAGLLAWSGYRGLTRGGVQNWRIGLYFIGAGICFGLGLRGVRERHRGDGDRD